MSTAGLPSGKTLAGVSGTPRILKNHRTCAHTLCAKGNHLILEIIHMRTPCDAASSVTSGRGLRDPTYSQKSQNVRLHTVRQGQPPDSGNHTYAHTLRCSVICDIHVDRGAALRQGLGRGLRTRRVPLSVFGSVGASRLVVIALFVAPQIVRMVCGA